jgi:hypothetical protein
MGTTDFESAAFDHSAISPRPTRGGFYQAGVSFSAPFMYGLRAEGIVTEPSAFW